MLVAAVVCAAGAGLVLLAAGRGWADATVAMPAPLPARHLSLSGGDVAPALNGLGLAGLAGLAGIIATRGVGRIVVGVLIVAIGAGTVLSSIGATGAGRVIALLRERTAVADGTATHTASTAWWIAAVAGGVLLAAAGAYTAARGRRWPGMSSRYEAPGTPRPRPAAQTPGNLWDSLDSGADPTADAPEAPAEASAEPGPVAEPRSGGPAA
jgi:uncharacterized membrane protein (TIGR02234 family)